MLETEGWILQRRYQLVNRLFFDKAQRCEVWAAIENPGQNDESPCLIRAWAFDGSGHQGHDDSADRKPPPLLLTLWSRELRHQLRLASLAGADQSLVVLHDAGVDEDARCFVTVHRADGQHPQPLAQLLVQRQKLSWLSSWKQPPTRARLWRGLLRIADGLDLLHSQQMLHRTLSDQSVLADSVEGPETFRLSGFEWTVRLGDRNLDALPVRPPELVDGTFSRATDWFLYGIFCAKLLIGTPPNPGERPINALVERLRADVNLFDLERNLLQRLIDPSPQSRISRSEHIHNEIFAILARLEEPQKQRDASHLALIVDLGKTSKLTQRIRELQDQEALEQRIQKRREREALDGEEVPGQEPLTSPAPPDQRAMLEWIERDFLQASLVRSAGSDFGTLCGRKLRCKISEHAPYGQTRHGTWELAFTNQTWDIRAAGYYEDLEVKLPVPVRVFVTDDVRRDRARVIDQARSWKPFMTRPIESNRQAATERRFVDFLSLTNQIEALMHDAQIFGYEIIDRDQREETDYLALRQRPRDQNPPEWALRVRKSSAQEGLSPLRQMLADLRNEEARTQPDNPRPRVQLTESERLRLLDKVVDRELWEVLDANELLESCPLLAKRRGPSPELVFLRRAVAKDLPPPMSKGFLRPADHWRQTLLVARRQKAIQALPQHGYLLRALLRPDLARINARVSQLPLSPDKGVKESERLDQAKRTALQNIWKTRPIFTLQGPPGTGKTTLVTALLRQIFAEDQNAQVLVTAQAHPAVDTLRERVKRAYQHEPLDQHPLAIRMKIKGTTADHKHQDDDYPEQVARRLLSRSYERLHGRLQRSEIQQKWYLVASRLRSIDAGARTDPDAGAFLELLRRAANITYCTSTAGDLAVLATRCCVSVPQPDLVALTVAQVAFQKAVPVATHREVKRNGQRAHCAGRGDKAAGRRRDRGRVPVPHGKRRGCPPPHHAPCGCAPPGRATARWLWLEWRPWGRPSLRGADGERSESGSRGALRRGCKR